MKETQQAAAETTAVVVSQAVLVRIIEIKNKISTLKAEQGALEEDTKNLILAGAKIEEGVHLCELKTSDVRRPSWRDEFVKVVDKLKGAGQGEKYADKVTESTTPTSSIQLKIK